MIVFVTLVTTHGFPFGGDGMNDLVHAFFKRVKFISLYRSTRYNLYSYISGKTFRKLCVVRWIRLPFLKRLSHKVFSLMICVKYGYPDYYEGITGCNNPPVA